MTTKNDFVKSWLKHRRVLLALLDTVQDEQLQYKPWETAMSLAELVLHMNGAMDMFVHTVKNGQFTPPTTAKSVETIEELKTIIEAETAATKESLESFSDEQLEREIDAKGIKMSGIAMLENAKEHEIHHKGQLFIYLRLLGIETLPFFISRS